MAGLFIITDGQIIITVPFPNRHLFKPFTLIYNELTLSQISYDLNYSSPQHLSRQFKQITGMTPTVFKNNGKRKKLDTI